MKTKEWKSKYEEPYVGMKFYEWTIVDTLDVRSISDRVLCECSCGERREVIYNNLILGQSKSCGFKHKDAWNSKYPEPLKGTQYNEWTLLEDHNGRVLTEKMLMRCSCGVEREVVLHNVIVGRSKSCGHSQYENLLSREMIMSRSTVWENRIGEIINGFKLTKFKRHEETKDFLFTFECPNGHEETVLTKSTVSSYLKKKKCWCEIKNPVSRMRGKVGLTLQDIGNIYGISREAARLYEEKTEKNKNELTEDAFLEDYSFKRLADAYELTKKERIEWVREIKKNKPFIP